MRWTSAVARICHAVEAMAKRSVDGAERVDYLSSGLIFKLSIGPLVRKGATGPLLTAAGPRG